MNRALCPYALLLPLLLLSACYNPWKWIYDRGGTSNTRDTENIFPLALGGVAPDWDFVEIDDGVDFDQLRFTTDNTQLLHFEVPEGMASFEESRSAILIPVAVGTTNCEVDAIEGDESSLVREFVTITPPQKMIQILIAEARGPLVRETIFDNGNVDPGSISHTGEALAFVIKNRVETIRETQASGLFAVDGDYFNSNPPASEYEAVIEANAGDIFQFSPVDPDDINHDLYLSAAERANLGGDEIVDAYDQAVTSAALVFNGNLADSTGGAFGFYSPTESQYNRIEAALLSETTDFPENAGTGDDQFPAFAPIQILILSDVVTQSEDSDIPAFVFVRARESYEPAVEAQ